MVSQTNWITFFYNHQPITANVLVAFILSFAFHLLFSRIGSSICLSCLKEKAWVAFSNPGYTSNYKIDS